MGAAKKVVHLEQPTKQLELLEVTSSPQTSLKKKRSRTKPVPQQTIDSAAQVQSGPKEKAKPAQIKSVHSKRVTEKQAEMIVDFFQLSASLTRPQSLSHEQVEVALNTSRPSGPSKIHQPKHEVFTEDHHKISAQLTAAKPKQFKIPAFIFLVVLIVLFGFYVRLNQSINTLTQQVHELSTVKTTISTMDAKISTMETRINDLETLPSKTRAALLSSILQEMSQKTSYMSTQLETPEQQEKLMRAQELIQQVQTDLNSQY